MNKVIEVINVSKSFGKNTNLNQVLDGANMYVEEGEFVSLMGASGSGKSTLLYLIGGLDRNFEGNISLCGSDIGSLKDKQLSDLRLKNIGFVFQFYNLVMNLKVEDNILLPQTINGKSRASLKAHRPHREAQSHARHPFRRPAAARRHRQSRYGQPRRHPRRRANRQPRCQVLNGNHGTLLKAQQGKRPHDSPGHALREMRLLRNADRQARERQDDRVKGFRYPHL